MKFDELRSLVPPGGIFRTGHLLAGQGDALGVRRQLDRWVKSGRVRQLRRGVYQMQSIAGVESAHPFMLANRLSKGSYVSLHSILSHAGMIPEYVPVTTSITTARPEVVDTPAGRFQFRHVAKLLFWGFEEREVASGQFALMATPYKALMDLLYLTPRSDDSAWLRELRCEPPDGYEPDVLTETAQRMGSAKVLRAVDGLKKIWDQI